MGNRRSAFIGLVGLGSIGILGCTTSEIVWVKKYDSYPPVTPGQTVNPIVLNSLPRDHPARKNLVMYAKFRIIGSRKAALEEAEKRGAHAVSFFRDDETVFSEGGLYQTGGGPAHDYNTYRTVIDIEELEAYKVTLYKKGPPPSKRPPPRKLSPAEYKERALGHGSLDFYLRFDMRFPFSLDDVKTIIARGDDVKNSELCVSRFVLTLPVDPPEREDYQEAIRIASYLLDRGAELSEIYLSFLERKTQAVRDKFPAAKPAPWSDDPAIFNQAEASSKPSRYLSFLAKLEAVLKATIAKRKAAATSPSDLPATPPPE